MALPQVYQLPRLCSVDGCNNRPVGQGLCNRHYLRLKRHGDPNKVLPPSGPVGKPPPNKGKHRPLAVPPEDKCCPKCGITKPRSAYTAAKRSIDGLAYACKECHKIYMAAYYRAGRTALVACTVCGVQWHKGPTDLKDWQGLCKSCAMKEVAKRPDVVEARRVNGLESIRRLGGRIPGSHVFTADEVRGINNVNWRGGISVLRRAEYHSTEYRQWRMGVFRRDNFTCQACGVKGRNLHAHHIRPRSEHPELTYDLANGTTLCEGCHKKTDSYGGKQLVRLRRYRLIARPTS